MYIFEQKIITISNIYSSKTTAVITQPLWHLLLKGSFGIHILHCHCQHNQTKQPRHLQTTLTMMIMECFFLKKKLVAFNYIIVLTLLLYVFFDSFMLQKFLLTFFCWIFFSSFIIGYENLFHFPHSMSSYNSIRVIVKSVKKE